MITTAEMKAKEDLLRRVTNFYVETPMVANIYKAIESCRRQRKLSEVGVSPMHQCIIGEAGVGKTRMLQRYCNRKENLPREWTDGEGNIFTHTPVTYVITPSPFNIGALNERILEALKAPILTNERNEAKKRRAIDLMKDQGTEVLVLDEIQSVGYTKGGVRAGIDNIKDMANKGNACLILCGLPEAADFIRPEKQYTRRHPVLQIKPYSSCDEEFVSMLNSVEEQINAPFPLKFTEMESGIPQYLFELCEGYFGILSPLIQVLFEEIGISDDTVKLSEMKISVRAIKQAYEARGTILKPK